MVYKNNINCCEIVIVNNKISSSFGLYGTQCSFSHRGRKSGLSVPVGPIRALLLAWVWSVFGCDVCPRQGQAVALTVEGCWWAWEWRDLIKCLFFSARNGKLSIGSRFKPEVSILYKIPREIHRQEVTSTGTWGWALTRPEDPQSPAFCLERAF